MSLRKLSFYIKCGTFKASFVCHKPISQFISRKYEKEIQILLIEALKTIKRNREKILDLQLKISVNAARMSHESSEYGNDEVVEKVKGWVQSCVDLTKDCELLKYRISLTNNATMVSIDINGRTITKSISQWISRRVEFADIDRLTYRALNEGGRKDGVIQVKGSTETIPVTVVRNYVSDIRDKKLAEFSEEPSLIDERLEIVNATTELVELPK